VFGWLTRLVAPIISGEENIAAGPFGSVDTSKRTISVEMNAYEYLTCSGTGNLAFRKSVWERVGGFDENFLYGSDVDFTWRCVDAGYRIRSVSDAAVSHDWGTFRENIARYFKYGKARADLLIKHKHRAREQLLGEVILVPIYTCWLLGLPFTYYFPWYPLTLLLVVLKNIRKEPFKTVVLNLVYTVGFIKRFLRVRL
jgi:GT2 family glycosyltransferase